MEIDQLRDYEQTWDSLQRCVNVFPSNNGHIDIGCTLQEKKMSILPSRSMVKDSSNYSNT